MSETIYSAPYFPLNEELPIPGNGEYPYEYDYSWIYTAAIIAGFVVAYGIGANDVANAFATSVGAKSIKVWQAVVIAGIFECGGAILLGSQVTDTVRKGIVDYDFFKNHEDWLMIGMLCSIITVGIWLLVATACELPVSTTHSAVGGIIGFALATPGGADNVEWSKVGEIVMSWFLSPFASGCVAVGIYYFVRASILRSENSFERTMVFFPLLVFFTVALNVFFIMYKGGKGRGWNKTPYGEGIGYSLAVGAGFGIAVWLLLVPRMRTKLQDLSQETEDVVEAKKEEASKAKNLEIGDASASRLAQFVSGTDVHAVIKTDDRVASIHANSEKFPYRTERAFAYLQVFTATFDSFSHGANDVANSIGPLAAIYFAYKGGEQNKKGKVEVPVWILALGGVGITVGLATYGYKIMSALGVKMVKVTPSRGFSIELGAAFIIVGGSVLGLPLSTTHCQVGATVGVGMLEGNIKEAVNWPLMAKVFGGWVITLVVAGSGSALLYAFAVYSPSITLPLSSHNCFYEYGNVFNTTAGDINPTNAITYTDFFYVMGAEPTTGKVLDCTDFGC